MLSKGGQQRQDAQQQHGGGPQDGPAFDASDFPSLSAAAAQAGQHRSADGGSETFAALLGSQKGSGGAGQQAAAGPSFGEEDFPALPGSATQPPARQLQQDGSEGAAQLQQLQQQLGSLAAEGGGGGVGGQGAGAGGYDALRLQQQRLQAQAALKGVAPGAAAAAAAAGGKLGMAPPPDRFGLLGLLSVIRMTGALRCWVVWVAAVPGCRHARGFWEAAVPGCRHARGRQTLGSADAPAAAVACTRRCPSAVYPCPHVPWKHWALPCPPKADPDPTTLAQRRPAPCRPPSALMPPCPASPPPISPCYPNVQTRT